MSWSGWGDPARARELPEPVRALLRDLLGVRAPGTPAATLEEVVLPAVTLPEPLLGALAGVVGAEHVLTGHEARVRHTRGKSTPDLLRMRAGDGSAAPDAVVLPGSHEEVAELLELCSRERVAVVPFGGGTSVVGGLAADRSGFAGVVALDLRRLGRLLFVDEESMVAGFEPGARAPEAERLLAARGLTLGHFPQSFEYATLGGFAAARSSGQASAGYGRFDDLVVGLTLATPSGTLELGRAPKSAAGPDLRQLVLGSEGAFGVITSLRLRVRRAPGERRYEGWRFASFAEGSAAVRALAQEGPLPTVLRLSDETETMIGLAKPDEIGAGPGGAGGSGSGGAGGSGCLLIAGYEGARVASRHAAASAVLARLGGEPLGPEPGEAWEHGRFSAPYLRDSLLAAGATVETLETAGFWANLPRLYDAVRLALLGALGSPLVMCHISHVYETGASLYFTVVTPQDADPVAQWERAKTAVSAAIVAAGGTITHHHGVGRDHLDAYASEIGPVGAGILRAVKAELDPAGILNPGVLVPRD
ncbi:FAD-binding oxidoreductase [Nonomuraea gerenzanensis]|uniref:Alkyldihydroxyacetonephosphate synthase n=1 Tax=Nonomuraea gerenzanensis TaxID=93944 RepID=A0A1M4EKG8_9ACTN|nr:FAD-binding oxidoreductase [Nonomuraea gerenzanensis]UBU19031.1 FAD-binding oxidoreductase [Nonomuraea gerenzanensis]SBO99053.1 Alkyldihydroxyacetonephosphate synthase [Nonomuraea gerenzanensis]